MSATEEERRIAQKLVSLADRAGPQVSQSGDRLTITQGTTKVVLELNSTVTQSQSTPRFR